jgi:hypothetical protein
MKMPAFGNRKSQRGASQIEFTLSMMLTMFLIFWVFEMVMMVYTYSVLADAAKEGVRYAIVHGSNNSSPSGPSPGTTTGIVTAVTGYAQMSLHDVSAITINPSYPDGDNQAPHRVQVDVTYTYIPYIPLPFTHPSIHTTAQGRIIN